MEICETMQQKLAHYFALICYTACKHVCYVELGRVKCIWTA